MISLESFAKIQGVTKGSLYVAKHKESFIGSYIHKIGSQLFVDDEGLVDYRDYRKRVWLQSHDIYYLLLRVMNESLMSRLLSKLTGRTPDVWITYINSAMWFEFEASITNNRPQEMREELVTYGAIIYYHYKVRRAYDGKFDFRREERYLS